MTIEVLLFLFFNEIFPTLHFTEDPFLEPHQFFSPGLEITSPLFIQPVVVPPLQKNLSFDFFGFLREQQWRTGSRAKSLLVLLLHLPVGMRSPTASRAREEEMA